MKNLETWRGPGPNPEAHQVMHRAIARRNRMSHFVPMLPDEQPSPEQIAVFRAMPGERRLKLAEQLYWSARKIKAAGLRNQHPDWPEEQVKAEVRRIFLHARS